MGRVAGHAVVAFCLFANCPWSYWHWDLGVGLLCKNLLPQLCLAEPLATFTQTKWLSLI